MPVCQIPLRERSRGSLGIGLMMVNCIIAGMAHVVLFLGIYIRIELGGKAELLKNYNPDVLFHMMLSISATLIIFHAPGAKICYDCGNWKTRDRFHACFFFWLLAALLVSLVPLSALVLCAIHKGLIEAAFVAGFSEAAVRYKVSHKCCGAKGFDDWTRISWVNIEDVKPGKDFSKSSYRNPEGELVLPWAPWSCCNASILMVCDTIWEFIPHPRAKRRRRSADESWIHNMVARRRAERNLTSGVLLPVEPAATAGGSGNISNAADRSEMAKDRRRLFELLGAFEPTMPGNRNAVLSRMNSVSTPRNFTRIRRDANPGVKTTNKKKLPQAPKRRRKKPKQRKKAGLKSLARRLPKFSLRGVNLHGHGPIGASQTDSPFEAKLDVLPPKLELGDAVAKLDGWYRPAHVSRQALQERIFHRVGCGAALSRTVFWVIGMGMTTLLTIWIFQTSMDLAYNWGNPKMMAPGYILKKWPCSSGPAPEIEPPDAAFYEEELEQSSDEEEEEEGHAAGSRRSHKSSSPSWLDGEDDDFSEADDSTEYGEDSSGFDDFADTMGSLSDRGGGGGGGGSSGGGDDDGGDDGGSGGGGSENHTRRNSKRKGRKGKSKKKKKSKKGGKKKKKGKKGRKGKKGKKGKKGRKKKGRKGSKKKTKKGGKRKGKRRKKK